MSDPTREAEVYETRKDAGDDKTRDVKFWCQSLDLYQSRFKKWHDKGGDIIGRYRGEFGKAKGQGSFNILRSNVRTLRPALYSATPIPDVRRRHGDQDPTARVASEIMERAVGHQLDDGVFDDTMLSVVQDMLLVGRGVPWVRYEPIVSEDGKSVIDFNVPIEHVFWSDFAHEPCKKWSDVGWGARRHLMTREKIQELTDSKTAQEINLDVTIGSDDEKAKKDESADASVFKRAECWEIWDAEKREQVWIAKSWKKGVLAKNSDPLKLENFFPFPRPLYDDHDSSSLIPVPDYESYQNQAEELSDLTMRIRKLVQIVKWRGVYDQTIDAMERLQGADDGALLPSANIQALMTMPGGSLQNAIWLWPIDIAAAVLQQLYLARDQVKQTIYEISGISDILRGATDPNETLGAQQIKANWGGQRVNERQRFVQRVVRDLLRMKAEIMCEHVPFELLMQIAGIQLPPKPVQQPQPLMAV